jgi:hypothetical protein
MKMKEEHIVPLSRQVMILLAQLKQISSDKELLFPGDHDATKVMSENTVNSALRAMGYDTKTEVCGHGFRTMARGALGESGLWSDDAIERQLSHSERNNVRAAYIHTSEHLDERRLMIQWWADYLDENSRTPITPYDYAKNSTTLKWRGIQASLYLFGSNETPYIVEHNAFFISKFNIICNYITT